MDISSFDFTFDQMADLLRELAPLAERIEVEPRAHQPDETTHASSDTTFRLSCRAHAADHVVRRLADFQARTGVEVVFDRDLVLRLRHRSVEQAVAR